jgi:hypothetical protein
MSSGVLPQAMALNSIEMGWEGGVGTLALRVVGLWLKVQNRAVAVSRYR